MAKSTHSNPNGSCVDVVKEGDVVIVRHSKRPNEAIITYTKEEWQAFILGVKDGEFDFDNIEDAEGVLV